MPKTVFKVRDTVTGRYWNGNCVYPGFTEVGARWSTYIAVIRELSAYLNRLQRRDRSCTLPLHWQIEEVETIKSIKSIKPMTQVVNNILVGIELQIIDWRFSAFFDEMTCRGVIDQIEYIFLLKPRSNERFLDWEDIKRERAKLRKIGIKTRSFKEYHGMFGMVNREQALKARMTLDVIAVVDLGDLRKRIEHKLTTLAPLEQV
jgi:hypothetical protein